MRKLVKLYRIEHPETGHGVFRSRDKNGAWHNENLPSEFTEKEAMPTPWEEHRTSINECEFCAFGSRKELEKWWSKDQLRIIIDAGFDVVVYSVHSHSIRVGNPKRNINILFRKHESVSKRKINYLYY